MRKPILAGCVFVMLACGLTLTLQSGCGKTEEKEETTAQASPEHEQEKEEAGKGKEGAAKEKDEEKGPAHVAHSAAGEAVLTLDAATQDRIGLRLKTLEAVTRAPEIVAYGNLIEDPAASFTLRAPVSGVLRSVPSQPWPSLGEIVADQAAVAAIVPRLTAAEQLDVSSKLAAGRAEITSAAASLDAAKASYLGKKELRDQGKVVSDRAVEEAEAKVKIEEARLKSATETVQLIETSLGLQTGSPGKSLVVPRGGEIVELFAQPDEIIESGQPVLRVARRDRLMARVELPAGEKVEGAVASARIVVIGHEDWVVPGESLGLAPTVSQRTQGQAYLFRLTAGSVPLRPGMAVTAYLTGPGEPLPGVVVPRSAVIRYAGLTWVYLRSGDDEFTRREIPLLSPTETGWFVTTGVSTGDTVVEIGAQVLLSEELKAQIEREEEAAE